MDAILPSVLFLLLGCNNTLTTPRGVPIEIDGLTSALWKTSALNEREPNYAQAKLLLSSKDVRCADFLERDFDDALWRGDHVLIEVTWYFAPWDWSEWDGEPVSGGWAGHYASGLNAYEHHGDGQLYRRFSVQLYDNGVRYSPDTEVGTLDLTWDGGIHGELDHPSVTSRFTADSCGVEESDEGYDTGWRG